MIQFNLSSISGRLQGLLCCLNTPSNRSKQASNAKLDVMDRLNENSGLQRPMILLKRQLLAHSNEANSRLSYVRVPAQKILATFCPTVQMIRLINFTYHVPSTYESTLGPQAVLIWPQPSTCSHTSFALGCIVA